MKSGTRPLSLVNYQIGFNNYNYDKITNLKSLTIKKKKKTEKKYI